jgi:hypothetical protein
MPLIRNSAGVGIRGMCCFCCRFPWEDPPHTCGFPLGNTPEQYVLLRDEVLSSERERWLSLAPQGADRSHDQPLSPVQVVTQGLEVHRVQENARAAAQAAGHSWRERNGAVSTLKKIADPEKHCRHPEHEPPTHIVLEPGTWEHTCPGCGCKRVFVVGRNWA